MALDVSEKYLSHIHRTPEHSEPAQSLMYIFAQAVVAELHVVARQIPTPCFLHTLNTFQVSIYHDYTVVQLMGHNSILRSIGAIYHTTWHHIPHYEIL